MNATTVKTRWIGRAIASAALLALSNSAIAMPMPPPNPDPRVDLDVSVQGTYTYDSGTGFYTYSYLVTNDSRSGNSLKTFGLAPIEYATNITAPAHWTGFDRWESRIDAIVWCVTDNVGPLPPDSLDTGDMPPSPYCAAPGQTVTGFSIVSRQPPGTVTWYAQGEDSLLNVEAEPFEGIVHPDDGFFGLMSVKGTTIGPDIQSPVGIAEEPASTRLAALRGASPNPFAARTTLAYTLRYAGRVRVDVFDTQGRRIRTLQDEWRQGGGHAVDWDGFDQRGREVASGVYFARILVDGIERGCQALVLLR